MISRSEIISDVLDALFNAMQRYSEEIDADFGDHKATKAFMAMYITDKARGLSDDELLTAFGDRVQVISEYVDYIKEILERSGKTVH